MTCAPDAAIRKPRPLPVPYSQMTAEQRREYHREATRRYRQRNPDSSSEACRRHAEKDPARFRQKLREASARQYAKRGKELYAKKKTSPAFVTKHEWRKHYDTLVANRLAEALNGH